MTRRKTIPRRAIAVSSYEKLQHYVSAFAEGHFNLLIIVGGAGLGKSQCVREAVGEGACWIEGNATAFGMYSTLWRNQNRPVVIDDVDSLYSDRAAVRLLKLLCQTDEEKRLAWHSAAARGGGDVPPSFTTRSRVIIIANEWKLLNENVRAVEDRGNLLWFEPRAEEVHRKVAEWFWDQEIFDWFGENLHLIPDLSMRMYVKASEHKQAGMHWLDGLQGEGLSEKTLLVAKLRADPAYKTEAERVKAFIELGGGVRSTYFLHARRLSGSKRRNALRIRLKNPRPTFGVLRPKEDVA